MRRGILRFLTPLLVSCIFFLLVVPGPFVNAKILEKDLETVRQIAEDVMRNSFDHFVAVGSGVLKHGERIPLPKYGDGTTAKRSELQYFVSPKEVTTSMTSTSTFRGRSQARTQLDLATERQKREAFESELYPKNSLGLDAINDETRFTNVLSEMDTLKRELRGQVMSQGAINYITCSVDAHGYVSIGIWNDLIGRPDTNIANDEAFDALQKHYKDSGISRASDAIDPQTEIYKGLRERLLVNYLAIAIRHSQK
jgi:hypothetical protein